ncbi:HAMP domain-containing sensor histidine kinase [Thalassotalea fonticola]|uniref:histidine kinase n=1 Tax=Thalassotalea fonticola TaxID=3065649 RepID=A0ABZ0GUT6_9GAMM|nr:HAMP domain-containing sensor histidine kinase [Colwelliaceae bacterium S1-1]
MLYNPAKLSLINTVILLRSCSIIIQIVLVAFVHLFLEYDLPWLPIFFIIALEALFNIGCYLYCKVNIDKQKLNLFIQLLADICFLGCLLYFSGGATNSFVSLLLIPIAIAAVTLPTLQLTLITTYALLTYSLLLWLMPMHVMHGNMQGHFIGMWINFIFSAAVVSLVISRMAKAIISNEITIAKYREKQLKQEKIIALGLASAQVTHDLATPLATIRLLTDELMEETHNPSILAELNVQVERCSNNLHSFREMSLEIKNNVKQLINIDSLFEQIKNHSNLNYPNVDVEYDLPDTTSKGLFLTSDSSLLPAILNVLNNAIKASAKKQLQKVSFASKVMNEQLHLSIRDFGKGFSAEHFNQIGHNPIHSEQGLGMAMFLSNASFERLGGRLTLSNHPQGGALVMISLPLQPPAQICSKAVK